MKLGERVVSLYEIIHGRGARWYWDRRYVSESELEEQEPLPATLLTAIDSALEKRLCISIFSQYGNGGNAIR